MPVGQGDERLPEVLCALLEAVGKAWDLQPGAWDLWRCNDGWGSEGRLQWSRVRQGDAVVPYAKYYVNRGPS